mgnify:CR=1 FL=1
MWVKITPDMSLTMDIELTGIDERTRDGDVQLFENVIGDALRERLKKVFPEDDIALNGVKVGIARGKYIGAKAA